MSNTVVIMFLVFISAFNYVLRVSQSLIMGTTTIANALAFTPNFQKGLTAAARILKLINRVPVVTDSSNAQEKHLV